MLCYFINYGRFKSQNQFDMSNKKSIFFAHLQIYSGYSAITVSHPDFKLKSLVMLRQQCREPVDIQLHEW